MEATALLFRIARLLRRPPSYVLRRIASTLAQELEVFTFPLRAYRLRRRGIADLVGAKSLDALWQELGERPFPFTTDMDLVRAHSATVPRHFSEVTRRAQAALRHRVDLLGSGPVDLGISVEWNRDYKTGHAWRNRFYRRIEYNNLDRPSDVKFAWELSRMQWMIPLGQAFLVSGDERYATEARRLLEQWIELNPYCGSVNWTCTMEVAIRAMNWIWMFFVFCRSCAWQDSAFRHIFLTEIFLHGEFISGHLERSDVNGNHYTADAAGLVFCGLFFGEKGAARQWARQGREILETEILLQVFEDGVDYEASTAYHRLVAELFFYPALYLREAGAEVSRSYSSRLARMARFTAVYSRLDGSVPLWGDADDARALPLGTQPINDHRYLVKLIAMYLGDGELGRLVSDSSEEPFWVFGSSFAEAGGRLAVNSQGFPDGGVYVMRNEDDHVFIDCGPLGLAGRGGHGHNDLLSFSAVLCSRSLIVDCGSYVYTADYKERNRFRSTAYHNTPQVDGLEINRFVAPRLLWYLTEDATPAVSAWRTGDRVDEFVGSHDGYQRLAEPVGVSRTITLDHAAHILTIEDNFESIGSHEYSIPFHLSPEISILDVGAGHVTLSTGGYTFIVNWGDCRHWHLGVEDARISESYGKFRRSKRLCFYREGRSVSLKVTISPVQPG